MRDNLLSNLFFITTLFNCSSTNYSKIADENPKHLVESQDSLIQKGLSSELQKALVKANINLGVFELKNQSYDTALSYFQKSKSISDEDSLTDFYILLTEGKLLCETGKKKHLWAAIQKYNRATQFNPNSGLPFYFIGISYQRIDNTDFDLIKESLQKALLLSLDERTRKKTRNMLSTVNKREKRLKDFWK